MKLSRHGRDLTRAFCLTKRNWGPAAMVKIFEGRALIFAGAKIAATFSIAAACLRDCALNLSAQKDKTVPIQERTIATTNHHLHTHKADENLEGHINLKDILRAEMCQIFVMKHEYWCYFCWLSSAMTRH